MESWQSSLQPRSGELTLNYRKIQLLNFKSAGPPDQVRISGIGFQLLYLDHGWEFIDNTMQHLDLSPPGNRQRALLSNRVEFIAGPNGPP
jgi:hypothetical protein